MPEPGNLTGPLTSLHDHPAARPWHRPIGGKETDGVLASFGEAKRGAGVSDGRVERWPGCCLLLCTATVMGRPRRSGRASCPRTAASSAACSWPWASLSRAAMQIRLCGRL